jgi:hypothetical protein
MNYENSVAAKTIARGLMQELKEGRLTKIGIDEIRTAIRTSTVDVTNEEAFEAAVCRAVVNLVG